MAVPGPTAAVSMEAAVMAAEATGAVAANRKVAT
jgi:hypothetical protein